MPERAVVKLTAPATRSEAACMPALPSLLRHRFRWTGAQPSGSCDERPHAAVHIRAFQVGDADAALKFFDGYIAQKEKALKAFDAEVGKNQELAAMFAKNPIGTLHERGL